MKRLLVLVLSFVFCLFVNLSSVAYSAEYKNPCEVKNSSAYCANVFPTLVEMVQYINTAKKQPGQELDVSGFDPENILNKNHFFCQEQEYRRFVDPESVLGVFWAASCSGWVLDMTCSDKDCTQVIFSTTNVSQRWRNKEK